VRCGRKLVVVVERGRAGFAVIINLLFHSGYPLPRSSFWPELEMLETLKAYWQESQDRYCIQMDGQKYITTPFRDFLLHKFTHTTAPQYDACPTSPIHTLPTDVVATIIEALCDPPQPIALPSCGTVDIVCFSHVYRTWRDIARSQRKFWSVYIHSIYAQAPGESRLLLLLVQEFIGPDCPRHFTRGLSSRTSYPIKRPRDLLPPPAFSHPGNSLQNRQDSILRSHNLFRPSALLVYHHGSRENWPAQCSNWN
jgi:hypothetical protein